MTADINTLQYTQTGIAAVILIVGLVLLPNAPPTPPTASAAAKRMSYTRVGIEVIKNGYLTLLLLITGAVVGTYSSYIAILDIAYEHLDITQDQTGWLGFIILTTSAVVGYVCARLSEICGRRLKTILVLMLIVSTLFYLWLSLICGRYVSHSLGELYVASIIACAFMNGCIPLMYEQICEASFPIPEGIIVGLAALVTNFLGIIYLLPLSLLPDIDNTWLEWTLMVVSGVGCVVILVIPQRYGRADMDVTLIVSVKASGYDKLDSDYVHDSRT